MLRNRRTKGWASWAMRAGLLLTGMPKACGRRSQNQMRDRAGEMSDAINEKIRKMRQNVCRMPATALAVRSQWRRLGGASAFGVCGIGTGMGIWSHRRRS